MSTAAASPQVVMVTSSGKPLLRPRAEGSTLDLGSSTVSSVDGADPEAVAAALASGVMPTAEPPAPAPEASSSSGGDGGGGGGGEAGLSAAEAEATVEAPPPPPWGSLQEMEQMARFGAALLAFHTRLGLQLRHIVH